MIIDKISKRKLPHPIITYGTLFYRVIDNECTYIATLSPLSFKVIRGKNVIFAASIDDLSESLEPSDVYLQGISLYISNFRECRTCKELKPLHKFRVYEITKHTKKTRAHVCKKCSSTKHNRHRYFYKLSPEAVSVLIANGCQICGTKENLVVDHDHTCCPGEKTCGKCVRGFLCQYHNKSIGFVKESVEELFKLMSYILNSEKNKQHVSSITSKHPVTKKALKIC